MSGYRVRNAKEVTYRFIILGTSLKKLEISTSFLVAPHVILYENRCARIAWVMWMLKPPKKKKLEGKNRLNSGYTKGPRQLTGTESTIGLSRAMSP
jgi:hypothetical protein